MVYRILLNGKEEHSVHGRRLRRKIKEMADAGGFRGSVRNIKNKPQVEIRIAGDRAGEFTGMLGEEVNKKDSDLSGLRVDGPYGLAGEEVGEYTDFKVIREDELTEMVWALQGAGDSFLESAKGQKEILREIKNRDLRREYSKLAALSVEMESNCAKIAHLESRVVAGRSTIGGELRLRMLCISEVLKEPPYLDSDFIQRTQDIYYAILDITRKTWENGQRHIELIGKRKTMMEEYKEVIDERIAQIAPEIRMRSPNGEGSAEGSCPQPL